MYLYLGCKCDAIIVVAYVQVAEAQIIHDANIQNSEALNEFSWTLH